MKRSSREPNFRAQKKKKMKKFDCNICFGTYLQEQAHHKCRQCNKVLCNECMMRHTETSLKRCATYRTFPTVSCPYCRVTPFASPRFYITSSGRKFEEDVLCRIRILGKECRYLHGIHNGNKFVGFACLKHSSDFDKKEHSFHINDLEKLEKFGSPFDELVYDSKRRPFVIISTEDDLDYIETQFSSAEVNFTPIQECTIATDKLHEFLKCKLNPF